MPVNVHPYEPPKPDLATKKTSDGVFRISRPHWLIIYLYPVALIGSLYSAWLAAWWELGHIPQPNVDDPHSIGGIMDLFVHIPLLVALPFPILFPLGFVASFYLRRRQGVPTRDGWWWLMPVMYVLLCLLDFAILRWDPLRAVEWYGD